jgi:hypothetical protein
MSCVWLSKCQLQLVQVGWGGFGGGANALGGWACVAAFVNAERWQLFGWCGLCEGSSCIHSLLDTGFELNIAANFN